MVLAAVLGGLDVLEAEPERLVTLRSNVRLAARGLNAMGFPVHPEAAIIPLVVPPSMNIRRAGSMFHDRGIFLNSVEYPAVPISQQRFRVSVMANHTRADIAALLDAIEEVWSAPRNYTVDSFAPEQWEAA